jgi:hypothetical protein
MAAQYGAEVKTARGAWGEFRRKRSPKVLAAGIVVAVALRALAGDFSWRDGVAFALMIPIYVFGEWAIHVHLLHLPPFRFRGRRVELLTARSHRMHHEDPHRLDMILLGPWEAGALLALVPLVATVFLVPLGWHAALTAVATGYVLVFVYEWTHFLIHTAHRPRSRYYRSIWRGHRLHHFKNERYWHGITNTVSDRVLGTNPDQREVARSATARTLRPSPE